MAAQIIPFPNASATVEVDYIKLLRELQRLSRIADRHRDQITERIMRRYRRESVKVIRAAGIPFPDITDGL